MAVAPPTLHRFIGRAAGIFSECLPLFYAFIVPVLLGIVCSVPFNSRYPNCFDIDLSTVPPV